MSDTLREAIVDEYNVRHGNKKPWAPGDRIPVAGKVFDEYDVLNLVESALEFNLTAGRFTEYFEDDLSTYVGTNHALMVNSGSSANLLAFAALTSHTLGDRRIIPGDDVICVAAAFPTTVAPIIQCGAIPNFVDIELDTYNIDPSLIEASITSKTKAIFIAHTLGNPFDINRIKEICEKHDLYLIEDCCDALGSEYNDGDGFKKVGSFGDISTYSFYPAHHITTGEGGAVCTNNPRLHRIMQSLRDWGRDCTCNTGQDNNCGKRFDKEYKCLPNGYDHKYVYSHLGYNLKATDMQAALGYSQMGKLQNFAVQRMGNAFKIKSALESIKEHVTLPRKQPDSWPSWFGFPLLVNTDKFTRTDLARHLEDHNIQTRVLFAGNITKHPCFTDDDLVEYHNTGELGNTNRVMDDLIWIGTYPGLTDEMIEYMCKIIVEFVDNAVHS